MKYLILLIMLSAGCDVVYDQSDSNQTGTFVEVRDGTAYRVNSGTGEITPIGTPTPGPLEESP